MKVTKGRPRICPICKKKVKTRNRFCSKACHSISFSSSKNPRWNKGSSEYPNHSYLKKQRLLALKRSKGECEICGSEAVQTHHKDESRNNHELKNLLCVCASCHYKLHSGRKNKTSKFIRLYGHTIKELSEKYSFSVGDIYRFHKEGKLNKIIKRKNFEN